jgi:hypothetical protein
MPGLFSQRRGTVRSLHVSVCSVKLMFVLLLLVLLFYGYFILLYVYFILFFVILYYSMYYFILFYVTFECISVQTTATGCLPNCSWQIYLYQYISLWNNKKCFDILSVFVCACLCLHIHMCVCVCVWDTNFIANVSIKNCASFSTSRYSYTSHDSYKRYCSNNVGALID